MIHVKRSASIKTNYQINIKEISTPVAIPDYGAIYTKSDNGLYFQDGAGVEHLVSVVEEFYGEAYIFNNDELTVIETANISIALREILGGLSHGFTFDAGSTGGITSYQIGTGGAAFTRVNDAGHGLLSGDVITIRGSSVAAYNGVKTVSSPDTDFYDIDVAWDADGGASDWDQGASLTADAGSAGIYSAAWQMSTEAEAACKLYFQMNVNSIGQVKSTAEQKYAINDLTSCSSSCVLEIDDGDIIWLSAQSDGTASITNKHGEFNLRRL